MSGRVFVRMREKLWQMNGEWREGRIGRVAVEWRGDASGEKWWSWNGEVEWTEVTGRWRKSGDRVCVDWRGASLQSSEDGEDVETVKLPAKWKAEWSSERQGQEWWEMAKPVEWKKEWRRWRERQRLCRGRMGRETKPWEMEKPEVWDRVSGVVECNGVAECLVRKRDGEWSLVEWETWGRASHRGWAFGEEERWCRWERIGWDRVVGKEGRDFVISKNAWGSKGERWWATLCLFVPKHCSLLTRTFCNSL